MAPLPPNALLPPRPFRAPVPPPRTDRQRSAGFGDGVTALVAAWPIAPAADRPTWSSLRDEVWEILGPAIPAVLLGAIAGGLFGEWQSIQVNPFSGDRRSQPKDAPATGRQPEPEVAEALRPAAIGRATAWTAADRRVLAQTNALEDAHQLAVPTFLGNDGRRFYGRGVPQGLRVRRQWSLGTGVTYVGARREIWSGAGWTGQPTIVRDGDRDYLILGAFDHQLRKIDLTTGLEVWRYAFDDVIKGTATIYRDRTAPPDDQLVILQGSRQGSNLSFDAPVVPSFRAISFRTGRELWRFNVRRTDSYSRDNDSSPIDLGNGQIFNVSENAVAQFFNASTAAARLKDGIRQPQGMGQLLLYGPEDRLHHGGNLVAEASPARLGDRIFISAGAGRIYSIDINTKKIVWDFVTGTDIDGSTAISRDGKVFATIERQYVPGPGGIFKFNPDRTGPAAVEWFLPTGSQAFQGWEGGVIGTAALNDEYRLNRPDRPALFASLAIDGQLYLGAQQELSGNHAYGPRHDGPYPTPKILAKLPVGSSISTPIFTDGDRLVAATYNGVYLFQLTYDLSTASDPQAARAPNGQFYRVTVRELARVAGGFEATPVVWNNRIYLASRDGNLYEFE